jgi:glutaredoxin
VSIKSQWNLKFPDQQAVFVEEVPDLGLFKVHTSKGLFYTSPSLSAAITGDLWVPHEGKLVAVNGFLSTELGTEIETAPDKANDQSDRKNALKPAPDEVDSTNETREVLARLKEEISRSLQSPSSPEDDTEIASAPDKAPNNQEPETTVKKVNTDDIREDKEFVYYSKSKLPKIQYDRFGQFLETNDRREKIKTIFNNTINKANSWTIPYIADNEKMKIIVFSDPTCPYCQRMHRDIDRLNESGISVYYLLYPRALSKGSESDSAKTVVSMMNTYWCSETPQKTMDKVYNREHVELKDQCFAESQGRTDLPVQEHFLLGRIFNLAATPLTIIDDGRLLYGYGGYNSFMERLGNLSNGEKPAQ